MQLLKIKCGCQVRWNDW